MVVPVRAGFSEKCVAAQKSEEREGEEEKSVA